MGACIVVCMATYACCGVVGGCSGVYVVVYVIVLVCECVGVLLG